MNKLSDTRHKNATLALHFYSEYSSTFSQPKTVSTKIKQILSHTWSTGGERRSTFKIVLRHLKQRNCRGKRYCFFVFCKLYATWTSTFGFVCEFYVTHWTIERSLFAGNRRNDYSETLAFRQQARGAFLGKAKQKSNVTVDFVRGGKRSFRSSFLLSCFASGSQGKKYHCNWGVILVSKLVLCFYGYVKYLAVFGS